MFSTVFGIVTVAIGILGKPFVEYTVKKLKEEGYVYPSDAKSLKEKILDFLPFAVFLLPIVHFVTLASFIFALRDNDSKEKLYQIVKTSLVKSGRIYSKSDLGIENVSKVKEETYEEEKEEVKEEEKIQTNQAAAAYWAEQEEKHECPTLEIPTLKVGDDEEKGHAYQKKIR